MFNTDFCAWLQGYLALVLDATWLTKPDDAWTPAVRNVIRAHIKLTRESSPDRALTITNAWIYRELDTLAWKNLMLLVRKDFQRKPILSGFEAAYYLQGYFEIAAALRPAKSLTLNYAQTATICRELERNVDGLLRPILDFYWQMREFQSACDAAAAAATEHEPPELDTQAIQISLSEMFLHVIDESYGFSEQTRADLQLVHDAYKEPAKQVEQAASLVDTTSDTK
jgi:hypothetical protein